MATTILNGDSAFERLGLEQEVIEKKVPDLMRRIKEQQARVAHGTLYATSPSITGATQFDVLDSADDKFQGVRNIANAKLPDSQLFLIDSIGLKLVLATGATNPLIAAGLKYAWGSAGLKAAPVAASLADFEALISGFYTINHGGDIVLESDMDDFTAAPCDANEGIAGVIKLRRPIIVYGGTEFKVSVKTGTAAAVANTFTRWSFKGIRVTQVN